MSRHDRATIAPLLFAAAVLGFAHSPVAAQAAPNAAKTLGRGSCAQCHVAQNRWWLGDRHSRAAEPIIRRDPDYVRVATGYGTTADGALLPDGPCARCHATAISDRGALPFRDSVSCESCHGAAERWLEPHKAGDKNAGRERVGFVQAVASGLTDLESLDVLAATCTRCHYIVDKRLVASGHTSGRSFDYAKGLKTVNHWGEDRLRVAPEAYAAAIQKRFAELGTLPAESLGVIPRLGNSAQPGMAFRLRRQSAAPPARPADAPRCPTLDLPPFPPVDAGVSIEERLRRLDDRLRLLSKSSRITC
jgi:hypothetical protein